MQFIVATVVLLAASGTAGGQTARPRPQPPQPPARIEGKFVDAMRSTPLRGVELALVRVGAGSPVLSATSDSEGRFKIAEITPGRYQVHIDKTGFLSRRGHSILANNALLDLAANETIFELTVPLWPAAVLRGKVMDPSGELLAGAKVIALQVRNGKVRRAGMSTAFSDDQGDYRIYGLNAGRYYLAAIPRRTIRQSYSKSPDEIQSVATFYPGRTDLSQALPITVRSGDEMPVNIMLTTERTVHVRGLVSGPVRPRAVTLESLDGLSASGVGRVDDQNRFDIDGVAPGRYILKAAASAEDSGESFRAGQIIDVGKDGNDHVIAYMGQRALVKAAVATGNAKMSPFQVSVQLVPGTLEDSAAEGFAFVTESSATARVDNGWTALFRDVNFGLYHVAVNLGVQNADEWYIKSIQAGGRDVTDSAVMISPGTMSMDVQLSMSADGASVEGIVSDSAQQPRPHVLVVAIPDGKRRHNEVFHRRTTTDQYGIFQLRGLAPGSYRVFAFEDDDQSQDLKDDDTFNRFESRGVSISVSEKDRKRAMLRLIEVEEDE